MAVKIRLARHGSHKRPYYRVVVADSRSPRDGRFIEEVGRYNPLTTPKTINLDLEKIADWQSKGAQLTDAVAALVRAAEAGPKTETVEKKSKKQLAKEAEEAKRAAEAAAAEAEGAEE
ncbi:30S ribosomal protein S16 [Candidatus Collinsella stercoripullorum]|uniref:30S ribosomal protein S16 n=1 Tax=Candidatus Collinsella stercoripullorum TaxID=2838522 RepID=UPI001C3A0F4E|nr:30S ribosomal protein S16 [Candidatus Collinsella stercoripullorum]HJA01429.1 30S ribosomal protein S16 [Candidatus Collinsella stercoripullorum]